MAKIGERLFSSPLAEDLAGGQARIVRTCGRRLLSEDHRGILEYTERLRRVALRRGQVRITGDDLRLTALTLRELAVGGTIRAIELEGEG